MALYRCDVASFTVNHSPKLLCMLFLVPVFYALNWGMTDQPIRGLHRALGSGALHASVTRWLVTRPPSCHCVSASCLSTSFVSDKWQVGVTGFAHPHLVLWYHLVTVSNRRSCDLKHDFGLLWTPMNSYELQLHTRPAVPGNTESLIIPVTCNQGDDHMTKTHDRRKWCNHPSGRGHLPIHPPFNASA